MFYKVSFTHKIEVYKFIRILNYELYNLYIINTVLL